MSSSIACEVSVVKHRNEREESILTPELADEKITRFILECIQKPVPSPSHLETWSFNQKFDIFKFLAQRQHYLPVIFNFQ